MLLDELCLFVRDLKVDPRSSNILQKYAKLLPSTSASTTDASATSTTSTSAIAAASIDLAALQAKALMALDYEASGLRDATVALSQSIEAFYKKHWAFGGLNDQFLKNDGFIFKSMATIIV